VVGAGRGRGRTGDAKGAGWKRSWRDSPRRARRRWWG
jgi:hypothetical protein